VHIWLDHGILARLKALRGPGEGYSDVILRVAPGDEGFAGFGLVCQAGRVSILLPPHWPQRSR
jgi:hypothetical protein